MSEQNSNWFVIGINHFVPNMRFAADVDVTGVVTAEIAAAPALSAIGILSAQNIAVIGNTGTFAAAYNEITSMGTFGRNVTVVASGAATSFVTITGFDYLGQPQQETLTLNGTTPVVGSKIFRRVANVSWTATGATTINVGWGDRIGLPYRAQSTNIIAEQVSNVTPGNAGAITAGLVVTIAQTATNASPIGFYTPHASFVHDGIRTYRITYVADRDTLYGARAFTA